MLTRLFVLLILITLFCGGRTAGSTIRFFFGIIVFLWVIRLLFGFGLMLLPVVLVILIFSKVVVPFVVAFLRHFREYERPL